MWITFIYIIGLAAGLFWLYQLWSVVRMKDGDFPDRNDKLMWSLLVFFGFLLGAILFAVWKSEYAHTKAKNAEKKLEKELQELIHKSDNKA